MAINTENRRRSALRSVRPVADGTIDASDRAHAIGHYSGISYVAATEDNLDWTVAATRRHTWTVTAAVRS